VLEEGADVAFAGHAFGQPSSPGQAGELEGNLALQAAVGALGQPDRSHAAVADLAQEPVGADQVVGMGDGFVSLFGELGAVGEEPGRARAVAPGQHLAQLRPQVRVLGRQGLQPGLELGHRQVERLVEQTAQGREVGGAGRHRGRTT
jgi:hypothetical protein